MWAPFMTSGKQAPATRDQGEGGGAQGGGAGGGAGSDDGGAAGGWAKPLERQPTLGSIVSRSFAKRVKSTQDKFSFRKKALNSLGVSGKAKVRSERPRSYRPPARFPVRALSAPYPRLYPLPTRAPADSLPAPTRSLPAPLPTPCPRPCHTARGQTGQTASATHTGGRPRSSRVSPQGKVSVLGFVDATRSKGGTRTKGSRKGAPKGATVLTNAGDDAPRSAERSSTLTAMDLAAMGKAMARKLEVFESHGGEGQSLSSLLGSVLAQRNVKLDQLVREWDVMGSGEISRVEFRRCPRVVLNRLHPEWRALCLSRMRLRAAWMMRPCLSPSDMTMRP